VSPFRAFPFLANFPGPNFLRGIQIRWDGRGRWWERGREGSSASGHGP
jgi:hypothetical protein